MGTSQSSRTEALTDTDSPAEKSVWKGVAAIVVVWLALWGLGFPLAMFDDLYYIGAALNLVQGHGYVNSYTPAIEIFGVGDKFFCYLPLHSYVLMGWLSLMGVSRMAFTFFQCACGMVACAGLWKLLRTGSGDMRLALAICLCVMIFLGGLGLRPDGLGLAFLAWGLHLPRMKSAWCWFLCAVALFASVFTCPNYGVLALLTIAIAFYRQARMDPEWRRKLPSRIALMLVAFALSFMLFLLMINFEFSAFASAFQAAREMASRTALAGRMAMLAADPPVLVRLVFHSGQPIVTLLCGLALGGLVVGIGTVMFLLLGRKQVDGVTAARTESSFFQRYFDEKLDPAILVGLLLTSVLLYGPALFSASGQRVPALYLALVILFLVRHLRPRFQMVGWLGWAGYVVLFFLSSGYETMQLLAIPFCPSRGAPMKLQDEVAALNPAYVYLDEFALDAVYDYRLPAGAKDIHFSLPSWPVSVRPEDFPSGSVLVISRQTAYTMGLRDERSRYVPLPLSGLAWLFPNQSGNPYDCVIVPVTK